MSENIGSSFRSERGRNTVDITNIDCRNSYHLQTHLLYWHFINMCCGIKPILHFKAIIYNYINLVRVRVMVIKAYSYIILDFVLTWLYLLMTEVLNHILS